MPALETLVSACGVDNFLLGNQGGFDRAGLFALQEIKRRDPRIQYTVVLAYLLSRVAKAAHELCRAAKEKSTPQGAFSIGVFYKEIKGFLSVPPKSMNRI